MQKIAHEQKGNTSFLSKLQNQVNLQFLNRLLVQLSPLSKKEFGENTFASFRACYEALKTLWSHPRGSCLGLRY